MDAAILIAALLRVADSRAEAFATRTFSWSGPTSWRRPPVPRSRR